jgi:esterase/lipase
MKKEKIFIFPGSNGRSRRDYWYGELRKRLISNGYNVIICSTNELNLEKRANLIKSKYGLADIIIGHSLGAVTALKFAEKYKVSKLILVDPSVKKVFEAFTTIKKNHRRESNILKAWNWEINFANIKKNSDEIKLIHDIKMQNRISGIIKNYHADYAEKIGIKIIKIESNLEHFTSTKEENLFNKIINII